MDRRRKEVEVPEQAWLDAAEAASRLGVKPATLYAYVSRGQLRRRTAADGRRSEYHPQDIADLAVRGRRARPTRPSDIVVPTTVTRLDDDGPHYRGRAAVELAGTEPFEVVADLLWGGEKGGSSATAGARGPAGARRPGRVSDPTGAAGGVGPPPGVHRPDAAGWSTSAELVSVARASGAALGADAPPADRLLPAVAALRASDPLRSDLRRDVVVTTVRRLLVTLATLLADDGAAGDRSVATLLVAGLADRGLDRAGEDAATGGPNGGMGRRSRCAGDHADASPASWLVDAALVLLADHELASSTLAVRVAASARCDPYAAIEAGLAVLSGRRHGAASRPLELALAEVAGGAAPAAALERQSRDEVVPGFGLPLYPRGDPRAARLLALLDETSDERLGPLHAILEVARSRGLPPPTIDVALAGVTHLLGAPPGTAELMFAVARIAGWTAHALEQYEEPTLLRPRAVYVGR